MENSKFKFKDILQRFKYIFFPNWGFNFLLSIYIHVCHFFSINIYKICFNQYKIHFFNQYKNLAQTDRRIWQGEKMCEEEGGGQRERREEEREEESGFSETVEMVDVMADLVEIK